ncbi:MAG TPA: DEAD/DEAH box helicase [Candidatus Polarisedimenticolaceae bacterium]|nr:DEAD/DEAH box helicase [Candidatus Polarisedimenticolaceae bacterium]
MSLSLRLENGISEIQRRRGLDYFQRARARIAFVDGPHALAIVRGTEEYAVSLALEGASLHCSCSCPYFVKNVEPCKHVWAAILEADRSKKFGANASPIDLAPDPSLVKTGASRDALEAPSRPERVPEQSRDPAWLQRLSALDLARDRNAQAPPFDQAKAELRYTIDLANASRYGALVVELKRRDKKRDGTWGREIPLSIRFGEAEHLADPADRRVFALIRGSDTRESRFGGGRVHERVGNPALLSAEGIELLVPALAATARCFVSRGQSEAALPLRSDLVDPWRTVVEVAEARKRGGYTLSATVERPGEKLSANAIDFVLSSGYFLHEGAVSRLADPASHAVLAMIKEEGPIAVRADDGPRLVASVFERTRGAEVRVPERLRFAEVGGTPVPALKIERPRRFDGQEKLMARLSFLYDGMEVDANDARARLFEAGRRVFVTRDRVAEDAARTRLLGAGFRDDGPARSNGEWLLPPSFLPKVVAPLIEAGWRVEAEGNVYRSSTSQRLRVVSGQDWFELQGGATFGDTEVPLPALLAAARKGERYVRLGDGSWGVLPEVWLERVAPLAAMARADAKSVRFGAHQAGFLDALLAEMPEISADAIFEKARKKLARFEGVGPVAEPRSFEGTLRAYQREGLGWFRFLREFGFGGCLADDMGLGKTVQVLALLASRGRGKDAARPTSLVVAPRSVVFNWIAEARRFTPKLRVLDHTGISRDTGNVGTHDLIVTSYGTLRRDAAALSKIEFDYIVLDEAQAIKNASSQAAKAARLLRGRHRLALTGTPIENHLGELWSIFEFLNPGMLGSSPAFRALTEAVGADAGQQTLARALRPFILRRTKERVAPELPTRTEQTLWCELGTIQRRAYDELRTHYRAAILGRVSRQGLATSKIHVLEALLRLRQAACHPGLIDGNDLADSAKLDLLVERLGEVLEEGHKALVFSQFTSLLALVKPRLHALNIGTAYLDGATPAAAREEAVRRFQTDPDCRLFLLSLKAGGYGLNLTAAGYVFLLDPWWNPAVEAQAIDRAHRIGQDKPVIAYRLVARDTVEEKIIALQEHKRALADSILAADESVLRTLTREDLELLLG